MGYFQGRRWVVTPHCDKYYSNPFTVFASVDQCFKKVNRIIGGRTYSFAKFKGK